MQMAFWMWLQGSAYRCWSLADCVAETVEDQRALEGEADVLIRAACAFEGKTYLSPADRWVAEGGELS